MAATMGTVSTIGGRYLNNKVSPPQTPLASGIAKSMDALADSKTAKRSPEATKAFLDENLKDMVAEDMNVSSKGFMQFWRDNDPDNPNRVYEEAQKFGITPEKLEEAWHVFLTEDYAMVGPIGKIVGGENVVVLHAEPVWSLSLRQRVGLVDVVGRKEIYLPVKNSCGGVCAEHIPDDRILRTEYRRQKCR